jgi:integrase/recombinase XerD
MITRLISRGKLDSAIINLIKQFQDDCQVRGFTNATITNYVSNAKLFAEFLKERNMDFLTADKSAFRDYVAYLRNDRGLAQKTIERTFTSLDCFYDFLVEEELLELNPARPARKRYVRSFKDHDESQMRKIINLKEAATLVSSTLDTRDRAVLMVLLKTGIRRGELSSLDIEDLNLKEQTIRLKPAAKRSNRIVFFDGETAEILNKWLKARENRYTGKTNALFFNRRGTRLSSLDIQRLVERAAERVGLHDPDADRLDDRFTPHCCRHWFTTHLIRAGMPRDFVKELRGDVRREAIDIYNHIDKKELRESYLAHIPQLGI